MTTDIVVPEMGESVLEATVAHWLKKEGEFVNAGEVLVELETDKVNLEVGAKSAGILKKIQVAEGKDVKVGDVLGVIDEKAPQPAGGAPEPATPTEEKKPAPEPATSKPESGGSNGRAGRETPAAQISPVAYRLA